MCVCHGRFELVFWLLQWSCATFYIAWSLCLFMPCFITLFRSAWLLPTALWLARQDACTCFEPRVETANCQTGNWTSVREIRDWIRKFRNTSVWAVKVLEVVCRQWTRRVAEFSVSGVRVVFVYASKRLRMCGRRRTTVSTTVHGSCWTSGVGKVSLRHHRQLTSTTGSAALCRRERVDGRFSVGPLDHRCRGQQDAAVLPSTARTVALGQRFGRSRFVGNQDTWSRLVVSWRDESYYKALSVGAWALTSPTVRAAFPAIGDRVFDSRLPASGRTRRR